MKKLLNLGLFLTFLLGYLEWGQDRHLFIFQGEWEILQKATSDPISVLHPFILIPFAGQLLLLFTLFQPQPHRLLSLIALACLSLLMLMLLLIGCMSLNFKMIAASLPFLILAVVAIKTYWKKAI